MGSGMSRTQIVAYAALGVVLLLLGARALRAEPGPSSSGAGSPVAAEPVGSGGPGPASGDVVVHVSGAVREPGVYRLPAGSRVEQARRAGRRPRLCGDSRCDQPRRPARRRPAGRGAQPAHGSRRGRRR